MKVYEFGEADKPVIMLFPGTCCYWKSNFGHVIPGLSEHFRTLVVSYSGFDETEHSTFISELDETEKIEQYIREKLDGKLYAAYGWSAAARSILSMRSSAPAIWIRHRSGWQNWKRRS